MNDIHIRIINTTDSIFYGLDINGIKYTIYPENNTNEKWKDKILYKVYVLPNIVVPVNQRFYFPPTTGTVSIIPEVMLALFVSESEREIILNHYGDARNYLHKALSSTSTIEYSVGALKSLVVISESKYYIIIQNTIYEIPQIQDNEKERLILEGKIDPGRLETCDAIVVGSKINQGCIQSTNSYNKIDAFSRGVTYMPKQNFDNNEPILLENSTTVIFKTVSAAKDFIDKYDGNYFNYIYYLTSELVDEDKQEELQTLYDNMKSSRKDLGKQLLILAGSTVFGILIDRLLAHIFGKD